MSFDRRHFLAASGAALALAAAAPPKPAPRPNRIAVSTYSFWQFRRRELRDVEKCIDLAAEMGFDGVEILHRQMEKESDDYLQQLKRRAPIWKKEVFEGGEEWVGHQEGGPP